MQSQSDPPWGQSAPAVKLSAVATRRTLDHDLFVGRPTLLLFHGAQTAGAVYGLQESVRTRFPDVEEVVVACVVDLRSVPRLMRTMAEGVMRGAYQQAARLIPADKDPADYVLILPDWDGRVTREFGALVGLQDVGAQPAVVLLDGRRRIQAAYQGRDVGSQAVTMLTAGQD